MRRVLGALIGLTVVGGVASGCGPIEYSAVILGAHEAIAEAEVAGAEEMAPYEYTYAVEHLRKAREEVGQADYQGAVDMARLAREYARKAREIAVQHRREEGR
jgi:hypothetical protein